MASKPKKLKDVAIGDLRPIFKRIVAKTETETSYSLLYDDGVTETFDKATDPAIEIEDK